MLETSASELDRRDRKRKKKNPDTGFAGQIQNLKNPSLENDAALWRSFILIAFYIGFAEAQVRQYERLTRQMEPDLESYERQKQEMGEDFFPGVNTLLHGTSSKVSQAGVDRMVADLEKQWVDVYCGLILG